MAQYGELLDSFYDPNKEPVYNLFTDYFRDPGMTKIKDIDNYSMYMTKIHSLLGIEHRYVIAFVFKDEKPLGNKENLSNLKWLSLQTRTMTEEHDLPFHTYIPRRTTLDKKINITQRNERSCSYAVDGLPIIITLLQKGKTMNYVSSGSVVSALETYSTIISFT